MKKKTKKIFLYLGIVLVILIVFIVYKVKSGSKPKQYITQTVERGSVVKTVSETAILKSNDTIALNFEIQGRVSNIKVKEGMEVVRGQELALLEDADLNNELKKAEIALEEAKARAGSNNDLIREAENSEQNAKKLVENVEDLEDQKLEAIKKEYEKAKEYVDAMQDYYDSFSNKSETSAKLAYSQLVQAKNNLSSLEQSKETQEQSKDFNVQSAKNNWESAKEKVRTLKSVYTQKMNDASVQLAYENYESAKLRLDKSRLISPVNGKITKLNYKKGEVLSPNMQAFGEIITSDLILEADIPESSIVDVKLGQEAQTTFDALTSDDVLKASVIEIAPSSTEIQGVVYYKVKLKLEKEDIRLKAGMSADIDINVAKKENILKISQRAINKLADGTRTVLIIDEKRNIREAVIEIGLLGDEGLAEIKSGLKEGETIILQEKTNMMDL